METMTGKSVCGGVAIGKIRFLARKRRDIVRLEGRDPAAEMARFEAARQEALVELAALGERAKEEAGEESAAVFAIHGMMLEDEDFLEMVQDVLQAESINAECAVAAARDDFAQALAEMDDPYMQARAADVRDVANRVLDRLLGAAGGDDLGPEPVIVAAADLTPSETVQLDKKKILAFVTAEGAANSHTAILARTMGIPAIIQAGSGVSARLDGREGAVDGDAGLVHIEPDAATLGDLRAKEEEQARRKARLEELRGKPNITLDGREVMVYANAGSPEELPAVLANDAGGIGLFRSEFLFLEGERCPDEETQFAAYRAVAKAMGEKRAIIRTMDIGADKRIDYLHLPDEENPALGLRGVRLSLERPELFRVQLRALCRASAFGNLAVMFPMIASLWEVREAKRILEEVRRELRAEGTRFNEAMEVGIMIETPAAAVMSDQLAAEADFFSLGTNDLTQYTLAVDRQSGQLGRYCDPHHEAVFRLIGMVAENAHKHGIWVGVCGELAGDVSAVETLLRLGVDELSVSPPQILELRRVIRAMRLQP